MPEITLSPTNSWTDLSDPWSCAVLAIANTIDGSASHHFSEKQFGQMLFSILLRYFNTWIYWTTKYYGGWMTFLKDPLLLTLLEMDGKNPKMPVEVCNRLVEPFSFFCHNPCQALWQQEGGNSRRCEASWMHTNVAPSLWLSGCLWASWLRVGNPVVGPCAAHSRKQHWAPVEVDEHVEEWSTLHPLRTHTQTHTPHIHNWLLNAG